MSGMGPDSNQKIAPSTPTPLFFLYFSRKTMKLNILGGIFSETKAKLEASDPE
jgi:hypothetical protein